MKKEIVTVIMNSNGPLWIPYIWCIVLFLLGMIGWFKVQELIDQKTRLAGGPSADWYDEYYLTLFLAFCVCLIIGSVVGLVILFVFNIIT
jgi:hypothetical protein